MLIPKKSNDSDKETDNKQQAKACSSMSCTLLRLWGSWLLCVFYGLFYSYLRHVCDKTKK